MAFSSLSNRILKRGNQDGSIRGNSEEEKHKKVEASACGKRKD
jgi:hypothetical protein